MSFFRSIIDFVTSKKDISDLMSIHVETTFYEEEVPVKNYENTKISVPQFEDEEFEDLESQR